MTNEVYERWLAEWAPQHPEKEPPTFEQFSWLCEEFKITPEELFGMEPQPMTPQPDFDAKARVVVRRFSTHLDPQLTMEQAVDEAAGLIAAALRDAHDAAVQQCIAHAVHDAKSAPAEEEKNADRR